MLPAESRSLSSSVPVPGAAGVSLTAGRRPRQPREVHHVLMTADAVGGVWRYSVDLGRALARRGVRTTVAVMGPSPTAAQRREAERAGLAIVDRPFRLEWMEDPWEDVRRAGDWLLTLDRTLEPDVIHLNGYSHAVLPWSSPVIVVAHSCVRTWWRAVKGEEAPAPLENYRKAVAEGLRAARYVVAPTGAMLEALENEYGIAAPSAVIPNGAVSDGIEPDWNEKADVVLAAGRAWDDAKNIRMLCAVADRLPWPVHVAGEQREPGRNACLLTSVHPLGVLSHAEMMSWYRRAAIYTLPARYEPFGLSVLEAARAGCALVLGDIPSLRENWSDAARFVSPDDGAALHEVIAELAADRALRLELGRRAFERARAFTIDRTADGYLKVYEGVE